MRNIHFNASCYLLDNKRMLPVFLQSYLRSQHQDCIFRRATSDCNILIYQSCLSDSGLDVFSQHTYCQVFVESRYEFDSVSFLSFLLRSDTHLQRYLSSRINFAASSAQCLNKCDIKSFYLDSNTIAIPLEHARSLEIKPS